jgi:hypothetical protein
MSKNKNSLEKKVRYPQPHSISFPEASTYNPALRQRSIEYLHARAKYNASRQNKRGYSSFD